MVDTKYYQEKWNPVFDVCVSVLFKRLIIQYRGFSDKFYGLFKHLRLAKRTFHLASSSANAVLEREKSLHVAIDDKEY